MPRVVELIFRANNTSAIRALSEIATASSRTAAETDRAFYRSQRALRGASVAMGAVGRGMTALGGAVVGVGYETGKMAVNFQSAMERIHTQAQVSQGTVNQLSQAVLGLGKSGTVGYGPTELANALFHVESVASGNAVPGLKKVSAATGVLAVAAHGAALGNANLEQTTTAMMGIMASLHLPATKAAQAMGLINTTVGIGNMRMQDLVTAIGSGVIPAFKDYGLNAKDALSAIALFADQGTAASSSARQLATALHYLTAPGKKASEMLAELSARAGLGPMQLQLDVSRPGGLLAGMKDLQKMFAGLPQWQMNQFLSTIAPGGRGRVILQALNSITQLGGKMDALNHPTVGLTKAYQAWENTLSGKLHRAWSKIQTDMTTFGQTLIPIVSVWLPRFTNAITGILGWVTSLSPAIKNLIGYMAVGFVVGGPILIGLSKILNAWRAIRDMLYGVRAAGLAAAAGEAAAGAGGMAGGAGGAAGAGSKFLAGAGAGAATGGLLGLLGRGMARGSLGVGGLLERMGMGGLGMKVVGAGGAAEALLPLLLRGGLAVGAGALTASTIRQMTGLGQHHGKSSSLGKLIGTGAGGILGGVLGSILPGPGTVLGAGLGAGAGNLIGGFLGSLHSGGMVHYQSGGPIGSDNIPMWLKAGEGVLNTTAMSGLGARGLGYLNNGGDIGGLGGGTITPSPVYLVVDGRVLAQAVIRYTLQRGARGPSSLVGGSLMTGTATAVQRG